MTLTLTLALTLTRTSSCGPRRLTRRRSLPGGEYTYDTYYTYDTHFICNTHHSYPPHHTYSPHYTHAQVEAELASEGEHSPPPPPPSPPPTDATQTPPDTAEVALSKARAGGAAVRAAFDDVATGLLGGMRPGAQCP